MTLPELDELIAEIVAEAHEDGISYEAIIELLAEHPEALQRSLI